jgi:hypothetical protein
MPWSDVANVVQECRLFLDAGDVVVCLGNARSTVFWRGQLSQQFARSGLARTPDNSFPSITCAKQDIGIFLSISQLVLFLFFSC